MKQMVRAAYYEGVPTEMLSYPKTVQNHDWYFRSEYFFNSK